MNLTENHISTSTSKGPFSRIEELLLFLCGFVMVLNLQYLFGLVLPYGLVIGLNLIVCGFFFFLRFNFKVFANLLLNWIAISFVLISFVWLLFEFLFDAIEPNFNDLIRVCGYVFYFNWVFFCFKDFQKLKQFFLKFAIGMFVIMALQAFVEFLFPVEFGLLLSPGISKTSIKVSTTFSDSNSFADFILFVVVAIYYLMPRKPSLKERVFQLLFLLLCFYLVDISGSRQGLILWFILFLGWLIQFVLESDLKTIVIGSGITALLILVSIPVVLQYMNENQGSSVSRLFKGGANSEASTDSRGTSLEAGIRFMESRYFLIGCGSPNFNKAWYDQTKNEVPLPHNGVIFLGCQYGVFILLFFWFIYLLLKRAFLAKVYLVIPTFLIPFTFQPNFVYYSGFFLILALVDFFYFKENLFNS